MMPLIPSIQPLMRKDEKGFAEWKAHQQALQAELFKSALMKWTAFVGSTGITDFSDTHACLYAVNEILPQFAHLNINPLYERRTLENAFNQAVLRLRIASCVHSTMSEFETTGRTARYKAAYEYIGQLCQLNFSFRVSVSVRQLGEHLGVSYKTASRALHWLNDNELIVYETDTGMCLLSQTDTLSTSINAYTNLANVSRSDILALHDFYNGNTNTAAIHKLIVETQQGIAIQAIAERLNLHRCTVSRIVNHVLVASGLATKQGSLLYATSKPLDAAAEELGLLGRREAQRRLHEAQRAEYAKLVIRSRATNRV